MRARGIKAGDIVQVVRDCCGQYLGAVYRVASIEFISDPRTLRCRACGFEAEGLLTAWNEAGTERLPALAPVAWLRRFEPLAEPAAETDRIYRASPVPETVVIARGAFWTPEEWSVFLRRIEKEWPA